MAVHRRCIAKVGNYCGCKDNVLALYEKWKETVSLKKKQQRNVSLPFCF